MRLTNKLNLPQAIVNALSTDEYSRGSANISVTGLSSPPRQQALQNAHGEGLEEDASDQIFALLGKAVHHILEVAGEGDTSTIREKRYFMRVPGPLGEWVVSGAMDSIDLEALGDGSVSIDDWKTAKVAEMVYGVKQEREEQLNVYKVLLEANGFKVGRLRDIFILRDWSKVQAARENNRPRLGDGPAAYPESQVVVHEVRIWSQEEAAAFILGRVKIHQEAQDAYANGDLPFVENITQQSLLPECDDEERWSRGNDFAAIKTGGTRASKVGETVEEVQAWITEHTVAGDYTVAFKNGKWGAIKAGGTRVSKSFPTEAEVTQWVAEQGETYELKERPGESIKCAFYCSVSKICEQWAVLSATE